MSWVDEMWDIVHEGDDSDSMIYVRLVMKDVVDILSERGSEEGRDGLGEGSPPSRVYATQTRREGMVTSSS